ncbi:endonuclease III [Staphylococcus sp. 11261D007BR]
MISKRKALEMIDVIDSMFPDAECELKHDNPFELTIAVLLSAQCTDNTVNKVTKDLFQKYKTPEDYLAVDITELENDIRSIGLYRNKAKNIKKLCRSLLEKFDGTVPQTHKALESLAGVGRKTANVVMSVAFGEPSLAVDTHVERVSKRLGICRWKDSVIEVENRLTSIIPKERWTKSHHQLIFFGRYHCTARKPKCDVCPLFQDCREGQKRYRQSLRVTEEKANGK